MSETEQKEKKKPTYKICPNLYSNFDYKSGEFEYEFHLPGVDKKSVKLKILPDLFDLEAKRSENVIYSVTQYFPFEIDPKSVEANYENGLLKFKGKVKDPLADAIELKLE